jgi:ribosomal protein S18 acetylase RimI-like enzyme
MTELEVRPITDDEWPHAAGVLARAFQSNPSFEWMLEGDPVTRAGQLIEMVGSPPPPGTMTAGAWQGRLLVGVARMSLPPDCIGARFRSLGQPAPFEGEEPQGHARVEHSRVPIGAHEPDEPHWHIGPIAVEPGMQGRGIGHRVMQPLLARVDEDGIPAWLETDKHENVRFYEAHGFEIVDTEEVFGVMNWWMSRT